MVLTMLPVNNGMDTAEAASAGTISFGENVTYGTSTLIQVKTDLPSDTPIANFTADQNECSIDQSGNTVQWVGWIGMAKGEDNCIYLSFNFNKAFTVGQAYVLPKGAVFGFEDGKTYTLDGDYTFTFDGSSWTTNVENRVILPNELSFEYRYGANNLIQVNTNLPSSTPLVDFTVSENGCNIDQSANQYQQVGWIGMANADGTIVLTFNFNATFTAGQTYVLPKGSTWGFTDGSSYTLDGDYTFTFDGSSWSMSVENQDVEEPEEVIPEELVFSFNTGTANSIKLNTNLPASTPIEDFLATDHGCEIKQAGDQTFGWAGMSSENDTIVITFNFNSDFAAGQAWSLGEGSIFGFTDDRTYPLDKHYTFVFDGSAWTMSATETPTKLNMQYRYGTNKLIQVNTNIPATTPCSDFLADANGCALIQGGNQSLGWATMQNVSGTIVLTFNFNNEFSSGQTYSLGENSVFGFTDGNTYPLDMNYTFTFNGTDWSMKAMPTLNVVADVELTPGHTTERLVQFTNVYDFGLLEQGDLKFDGTVMLDGIAVDTADFKGYPSNTTICLNINHAGKVLTIMKGSIIYYGTTAVRVSKTFNMKWTGSGDSGTWEAIDIINSSVEGDTDGDGNVNSVDLIRIKNVVETLKDANNQCDLDKNLKYTGVDVHYVRLIILYGTLGEFDVLDEELYSWGDDFITFADVPGDTKEAQTMRDYLELGFNTGILGEDCSSTAYSATCTTSETSEIVVPEGYEVLELTFTGFYNQNVLQFKSNLPMGGEYSGFLATNEGFNVVQTGNVGVAGWFQVDSTSSTEVVYLNSVFNSALWPNDADEYVLQAGSEYTLNGQKYILDRTYTVVFHNEYLEALNNIDSAGLNVWVRNFSNQAGYFTDDMTNLLAVNKDKIDGFYMNDEGFLNKELYDYSLENYNANEKTDTFANIATDLAVWFNANYPNKYFHVNHVPITSYNHYGDGALTDMSAKDYKSFLENYKTTVLDTVSTTANKKTIGFDNYPFGYTTVESSWFGLVQTTEFQTTGIAPSYLVNNLVAAQVARDSGVPLSTCIQTYKKIYDDKSRDITTAAEVSLQLYTGMACGADIYEYFCYDYSNAGGTDMAGLYDASGNKREATYNAVKDANANALKFADVVNVFDWKGTQISTDTTASKNGEGITLVNNSGIDNLVLNDDSNGCLSTVSSTQDALVGYYALNTVDGYFVSNYNDPTLVTDNNSVTLTFTGCTRARVYTSKDGELTSDIVELTNGVYSKDVAPGDAFFIIPAN